MIYLMPVNCYFVKILLLYIICGFVSYYISIVVLYGIGRRNYWIYCLRYVDDSVEILLLYIIYEILKNNYCCIIWNWKVKSLDLLSPLLGLFFINSTIILYIAQPSYSNSSSIGNVVTCCTSCIHTKLL